MTGRRVEPAAALTVTTASVPGAVAILQLAGSGAESVAARLTGRDLPDDGRLARVDFDGIDAGLAGRIAGRGGEVVQLMPHGGPRVVQRLVVRLGELGAVAAREVDARSIYPEAPTAIEADMLLAMARAGSPAAVDLLAAQPARWRAVARGEAVPPPADRCAALDRLLDPPTVVVIGRPNVGKSTLTNTVLGRAVSIVSDLPGATRDWVGSLAELGEPARAVAVRWLDTPGLRADPDAVERQAVAIARGVVVSADLRIALGDPEQGWPDPADLPAPVDLWVMNKVDDAAGSSADDGRDAARPLRISARRGLGLDGLTERVLEGLGLARIDPEVAWPFSPVLRAWAAGDRSVDLAGYVGPGSTAG